MKVLDDKLNSVRILWNQQQSCLLIIMASIMLCYKQNHSSDSTTVLQTGLDRSVSHHPAGSRIEKEGTYQHCRASVRACVRACMLALFLSGHLERISTSLDALSVASTNALTVITSSSHDADRE
mmetsp:Transcript_9355/g.27935  ORF Transcript_9355/g.27935 Transcript_9355/m.27935 type:complete len:124 (+) Transcript_9355:1048-1419(+)